MYLYITRDEYYLDYQKKSIKIQINRKDSLLTNSYFSLSFTCKRQPLN